MHYSLVLNEYSFEIQSVGNLSHKVILSLFDQTSRLAFEAFIFEATYLLILLLASRFLFYDTSKASKTCQKLTTLLQ